MLKKKIDLINVTIATVDLHKKHIWLLIYPPCMASSNPHSKSVQSVILLNRRKEHHDLPKQKPDVNTIWNIALSIQPTSIIRNMSISQMCILQNTIYTMMLKRDLSHSQNALYMPILVNADVLLYQNILFVIKYIYREKLIFVFNNNIFYSLII